jgi:hypothetical protein
MPENDDLNQKLAKYGMKLEFWKVSDLAELAKKTKNPKKHYNKDVEALSKVIGDIGFKSAVYINKDATEIGAGVGRILAATRQNLDELPVMRILDLDKTKFKKFRIGDNRLNQLSNKWDEEILFEDLQELKQIDEDIAWMDFPKYDKLLSSKDLAVQDIDLGLDDSLGGETPQLKKPLPQASEDSEIAREPEVAESVHDSQELAVDFSSSNDWGIPDLAEKYQATFLNMPFVKWGEISYKKSMHGTWHFYVDDEKFERLTSNPMPALMSMPTNLVELNFSTYPTQPAALAIGSIFFKRWVARFWQSKGFNIIVDLNVTPNFSKLNLIGVPQGWKAYATRGSGSGEWIKHDWEVACEHSGADEADILFIVYGGGQDVQAMCKDHNWNWIPERMQIVSNPLLEGMDGLDAKVSVDAYNDLK